MGLFSDRNFFCDLLGWKLYRNFQAVLVGPLSFYLCPTSPHSHVWSLKTQLISFRGKRGKREKMKWTASIKCDMICKMRMCFRVWWHDGEIILQSLGPVQDARPRDHAVQERGQAAVGACLWGLDEGHPQSLHHRERRWQAPLFRGRDRDHWGTWLLRFSDGNGKRWLSS